MRSASGDYFLCNRYPDGSSYAEIMSCKIGDISIAVGRSLGPYKCTKQGRKKNGVFGKWSLPYPLRGEKPGVIDLQSGQDEYDYHESVKVEGGEAAAVATEAKAALAVSVKKRTTGENASPLLPPSPDNSPTTGVTNASPLLPSSSKKSKMPTSNPDCDDLTGDCYIPTDKPGISYPAEPNSDIDKNKIPAGNPDCDELTQDCYFPNVPSADGNGVPVGTSSNGNEETKVEPDCDELTGDCYFPTGKPGIVYPSNPNSDIDKSNIPKGNPDCDELTQDCYFPTSTDSSEYSRKVDPQPERKEDLVARSGSTCTFKGKTATVGQRIIYGELYVMRCTKTSESTTEIRLIGCLYKGGGFNFKKHFGPRNPRSRRNNGELKCKGDFEPNQLRIV